MHTQPPPGEPLYSPHFIVEPNSSRLSPAPPMDSPCPCGRDKTIAILREEVEQLDKGDTFWQDQTRQHLAETQMLENALRNVRATLRDTLDSHEQLTQRLEKFREKQTKLETENSVLRATIIQRDDFLDCQREFEYQEAQGIITGVSGNLGARHREISSGEVIEAVEKGSE
ncbi:hypothetical protein NMY22_g7400 [Coprinellus aureogranulatus]|nr:hypothetical protein NMY22_g7400 [Coprinellus aureogranulatus]